MEAATTRRARYVAAGVVVAVIGAVLGYRTMGASSAAAATPPTAAPTTSTTTANRPIDVAEREVEAFVENTRGLKFTSPVKVALLDDLTFKAKLLGRTQPDKAEVDKATGEMRALGFVPPGFDLVKATEDSATSSILGFYDFTSKELVVRGDTVTPYVKEVMAHELTHALDDQHFGLSRPGLFANNDEKGDSFRALSEGDATHVELAYYETMSAADKASADAEEERRGAPKGGAQAAPPALGDFGIYPYIYGDLFVDKVVKEHGQAGLNAVFANPPVSSAQILTPKRYYAWMPGASAEISAPALPDGKQAIDHGVIGQFGLFVMLRQTMGDDLALLAAQTWEGDTYVAWKDGAKTCVRARFLTESEPTAYPLALLLDTWVQQQGGGTVEEPGTVLLTTCR